ncbi:hypothetical protein XENOCAPTIV_027428, partial [Xenoophorus captivus]
EKSAHTSGTGVHLEHEHAKADPSQCLPNRIRLYCEYGSIHSFVKELKEEIEERNRQVQEAQKKVQDLLSERYKEEITASIKANFEKVLQTERTLKTQVWRRYFPEVHRHDTLSDRVTDGWYLICQAVNKLAEIMNRKDMKLDHKKKGSTAELRKKEKDNRKLQQELNQEKEKFNIMAIKYQKELNEMQAVGYSLE